MAANTRALGPYYNYSNELIYPSEIPITRDGDIISGPSAIMKNAVAVQYYVNAMGTGTSVGATRAYPEMAQSPMGLNYFFDTGMTCSNGAAMYQYQSTIPTGMPGAIGKRIAANLGGNLQGLAPGVVQDTMDALNPLPIFNAVMGTGYPKCKLQEAPVGDVNGRLASRFGKPIDKYGTEVPNIWVDPTREKVYYKNLPPGDGSQYVPKGAQPFERRWVFDSWISQDQYKWTQQQLKAMGRLYNRSFIPDQSTPPDPPIPPQPTANQIQAALQDLGLANQAAEGFCGQNRSLSNQQMAGGLLVAGLVIGLLAVRAARN
jgi:hypothetical protein